MRHSKFTPQPFLLLKSVSKLILQSLWSLITMSCPFFTFPKKESPDASRHKEKYVTIDIPLDPQDPSSQKISHEYKKLNSTEIKDILEFFSTFDDVVNTLELPRGPWRFRLIPAMMGHDAQKKWFDVVNRRKNSKTVFCYLWKRMSP